MEDVRLTQYSHGAGCGCKISPQVLDRILHSQIAPFHDPNLLVGNESKDDAVAEQHNIELQAIGELKPQDGSILIEVC